MKCEWKVEERTSVEEKNEIKKFWQQETNNMLGSVCCGTTMERIEMDGGGGRVNNKPIS